MTSLAYYCRVNACAKCQLRNGRCVCACHRRRTMQPVDCPHCERECAGPAGLASHIRSMHPNELRVAQVQTPPPRSNGNAPDVGGIVWEDPPARGRKHQYIVAELRPLVVELRRHPGRWARVRTFPKPASASATAGTLRKIAEFADITFIARRRPDGTSAIWARFVEGNGDR